LLWRGGMLAGMSDEPNRILRCYEGKRHMYLTVVRAAQAGKLDELNPMAVELATEARYLFNGHTVRGWASVEADLIELEQRLIPVLHAKRDAAGSGGYAFTLDEIIYAIREYGWAFSDEGGGDKCALSLIATWLDKYRTSVGSHRGSLIIAACLDAMFAAKEAGLEVRL